MLKFQGKMSWRFQEYKICIRNIIYETIELFEIEYFNKSLIFFKSHPKKTKQNLVKLN